MGLFLMERLTRGALQMSNRQTLKDLHSATSSQELEDGQEPCSLRGGVQIDLFGQAVHLANLSQPQEINQEKKTSDISGLSSSISSASADLQKSLANKLLTQLDLDGLTTYTATWKHQITPQQRSYYQVALSNRRTNDQGYSLWPTPATRDYKDTGDLSKSQYRKIKKTDLFGQQVLNGKERNDTVPRIASGVHIPPSLAMEKPGQSQLNPRFSLWLMGYPIEWAYCAERVTQSSRKRQQKS